VSSEARKINRKTAFFEYGNLQRLRMETFGEN
jgi:hypothetical protein